MSDERLFTYLMTHDSGFAPNPFFNSLTLATCMSGIRRTKKRGQWIAGFASKSLVENARKNNVTVKYQALIYLMKVDAIKTLDEYYRDPDFVSKKPIKGASDPIIRCGDNIYFRDQYGEYRQRENDEHDVSQKDKDLSGKKVLISKEYYYFGRNSIAPVASVWGKITIPARSTCNGYANSESTLNDLRNFLKSEGFNPGCHGHPCLWDEPEDTNTNFTGHKMCGG